MSTSVAVIVIGVLYPVSFAALVISFCRLRSDLHAGFDRLEARFDKLDQRFDRLEARFDKLDERFDSHFDRLEAKFDGLESPLVGKGQQTEPVERSGADD